jgi:5-methylcytosine-specific restriction endonuclease McrA
MPTRICRNPRCGTLVKRGYCPNCAREAEQARNAGRAEQRAVYATKRWAMTRRRQLFDHPLCDQCGIVATDVHHVVDLADGGPPYDLDNLQSLCQACHSRVTLGRLTYQGSGTSTAPLAARGDWPAEAGPGEGRACRARGVRPPGEFAQRELA